jgi:hypothetical protein
VELAVKREGLILSYTNNSNQRVPGIKQAVLLLSQFAPKSLEITHVTQSVSICLQI